MLGSDRLVLSWIEPPASDADARAAVATIADAAQRVNDAGLRFGFHNHWAELERFEGGSVLDSLLALPADEPLARARPRVGLGGRGRSGRAAGTRARTEPARPRQGLSRARHPGVLPCRRRRSGLRPRPARGARRRRRLAARRAGRDGGLRLRRGHALLRRGAALPAGRRVNGAARVGVVGCGVIAHNYVRGSVAFESFDIVACADLDEHVAAAFGAEHGLRVASVDDLVADPEIDAILSLTPPGAHAGDGARGVRAREARLHREAPCDLRRRRAQPRRRWRPSADFASAARPTRSSALPTRRAAS